MSIVGSREKADGLRACCHDGADPMRLFQNIFGYPAYFRYLDGLCGRRASFSSRRDALIEDGCNGVHVLEPISLGATGAFLTCAADARLQKAWAKENGLSDSATPDDVVLAQIEHARAEVFYTQAPYCYGPEFLKRLPGSVRVRVGWHSPPAPVGDISGFDLIVNNFPRSLAEYAKQGVRTAYFTPSFDPVMADYCDNKDRPIDVVFVGGYSRHHRQRAAVLEAVADLRTEHRIVYALDCGRLTRLAETPFGFLPSFSPHARPKSVRAVSGAPVFGRAMYDLFSRAKIVLNGAVDSAAGDRGNMRCFEAMGGGALLLSDSGRYPDGMEDGRTMVVYEDANDAVRRIRDVLTMPEKAASIAAAGLMLMKAEYSKSQQWARFQSLL